MKDFATAEWNRALRSFAAARSLTEIDPDSAASRAYYAAFHAVTALFVLRNLTFTKHAALRAALHRDLVRTGEWPEELGRDFDYLMDLRETGDYGGITQLEGEDIARALKKVHAILSAVSKSNPDVFKDCWFPEA